MEKAKREDLPEIMALINQAYSIETGNSGISFKNAFRFRNLGEAEAYLSYFYILRTEGEIVAVIKAKLVENFRVVSIGPVAVHPNHQGKGYGARILDFAESLANVAQIECVSCRTDLFPFYARRGYKEVRRVPLEKYVPIETITRPGLEMIVMQKGTFSNQ